MDISVIVVTYNQEATISRTLDSILAQRFAGSYEIVIGDDCSTDNTERICREYALRYPKIIRYIRRDKNLGLVRNYFDCIAQSRGKYLADCAGDDYWVDAMKLEHQFHVLQNDAEVSMVLTEWVYENIETGEVTPHNNVTTPMAGRVYDRGELSLPLLRREIGLHLCTAMYRRSVLDKYMARAAGLFSSPEFTCEDLQIQLSMSEGGKIAVLEDVTLHYSIGGESISHRKRFADRYDYTSRTFRQRRYLRDFFGIESSKMRDAEELKLRELGRLALRSGSLRRMRDYMELLGDWRVDNTLKDRIYYFIMKGASLLTL